MIEHRPLPFGSLTRRTFGSLTSAVAFELLTTRRAQAADNSQPPAITGGVSSGDVRAHSAVVWSRCDRTAEMFVEYGVETEASVAVVGPVLATAASGFTARVLLSDLPAGQRIHYRVWFRDSSGKLSPPAEGHFQTAPADDAQADIFFAWSGDVAGQGFGINPAWGGMKIFESIRRLHPQFFVHSGDHIYADDPIPESIPLADGGTWVNVVTPGKSHAAQTLEDFRDNYAYNLLDEHVRQFHAEVPLVVQWDDHETTNNWYPGETLANRKDAAKYPQVKSATELAARAKQAFFEFMPIGFHEEERDRIYRSFRYGRSMELFVLDQRSYRGPNSKNTATSGPEVTFLGQKQLQWLKDGLKASQSTWKVIASDMPIGMIVGDALEGKPNFEAVANAEPGKPSGRELEFAELFRFLKAEGVKNVIWLTADVHHAVAHRYSPEKAGFGEPFEPFWEFVAGPLNAGTFGPSKLDATFGPEVKFQWAPKAGMTLPSGRVLEKGYKLPLSPIDGLQTFGTVRIDGATQKLTVEFRGIDGEVIVVDGQTGRIELEPAHR
ncbi:MAG TPA: alkaline phosphatase D family protein [Caulifigura sp.]|nr:alkaline phosphatase D family protein [Caulifigura sp.]